jgi:hypothetical protein
MISRRKRESAQKERMKKGRWSAQRKEDWWINGQMND